MYVLEFRPHCGCPGSDSVCSTWVCSRVLLLRSSPWFTTGMGCVSGDPCMTWLHLGKLLRQWEDIVQCELLLWAS